MKKFQLDLSEYKITVPKNAQGEMQEVVYPLRDNISVWLRSVGVFKCANDIAEAITLAKYIMACEDDDCFLDERETDVLKTALDRFIELTAEGKANVGGEVHEEAILRIVNMKEVE